MLPAQRILAGNRSIVTAIKPQNNNELCSAEDNSPAIQQLYLYHVFSTLHYILTCMPSFAFFQISHTFASITALFFLTVKKLSDVTVMSVKKALTQLGVTVPKGQSYGKESLVILLGKELFGKGKVRRKDETKVIAKDNLVLAEKSIF